MWTRRPTLRTRTTEPAFCVRFSPDDKVILSTHFDGTVVGYDCSTGTNKFEFNVTPRDVRSKIPVTAASFRPGGGKPLLLLGCSDGSVDRWELRFLEKVASVKETGNEVYAVEYRSDGAIFGTAGRDAHLRIYDDTTGSLIHNWATVPEGRTNPAAVRLYSVVFAKDDPNLVFTAGWGKTVYIFDMRQEDPVGTVKEVFGPYLAGDSLSVTSDCILTAAHRLEDRLQLWDRTTLQPTNIAWPTKNEFLPSCAKFSNDAAGEYFAVGGGGGGECKDAAFVYDRKTSKLLVDATFEKTINSCAFANREALVAFGDGDGQVHLFEPAKAKQGTK
jgi:COMPASS component SWD3